MCKRPESGTVDRGLGTLDPMCDHFFFFFSLFFLKTESCVQLMEYLPSWPWYARDWFFCSFLQRLGSIAWWVPLPKWNEWMLVPLVSEFRMQDKQWLLIRYCSLIWEMLLNCLICLVLVQAGRRSLVTWKCYIYVYICIIKHDLCINFYRVNLSVWNSQP